MKLRPRTLRVFPNPWGLHPHSITKPDASRISFDPEGRPCGAVPLDPNEHGGRGTGRYVGAEIDDGATYIKKDGVQYRVERGMSVALEPAEGGPFALKQRTVFKFRGIRSDDVELAAKLVAAGPEEIPFTGYYVDCLRDGSLIAADLETYLQTNYKADTFAVPASLIPELEKAAITAFNSSYEGVDAFAHFQAQRAPKTTRAQAPSASEHSPSPSASGSKGSK